jgi:hypothetical protein
MKPKDLFVVIASLVIAGLLAACFIHRSWHAPDSENGGISKFYGFI